MNEKPGSLELLEPPSPEALVPDSWVEPWMIVVAVVLALGLIAVLIFRKHKLPPPDPLAIRELAHIDALVALDAIGPVTAREAAVQSSLILRKYLAVVAADPALFETHEETLSRHDALKEFSEDARGSATLGFSRLAAIKYAAVTPDMAPPEVIAGSQRLLEILHHGLQP